MYKEKMMKCLQLLRKHSPNDEIDIALHQLEDCYNYSANLNTFIDILNAHGDSFPEIYLTCINILTEDI